MLYLPDSLLVCTLLHSFLFAVTGGEAWLLVGGGMWIEDTNIQKGSFRSASPETVDGDVKPCTILTIRCGACKDFPSHWLQFRLNTDITADFC